MYESKKARKEEISLMGYDMNLVVLKRSLFDTAKKYNANTDFSTLYHRYLWIYLYPEEYDIPKDAVGRIICSENTRVFDEFSALCIENNEACLVSKELFRQLLIHFEHKLRDTSLLYFVNHPEKATELAACARVFNDLKNADIDFEKEIVVFTHGW